MLPEDMYFKVAPLQGHKEDLVELFLFTTEANGIERCCDVPFLDITTEASATEVPVIRNGFKPFARFTPKQAQKLADALYNCVGVKASEDIDNVGAIAAQDAHIKDLRSIIASMLQIWEQRDAASTIGPKCDEYRKASGIAGHSWWHGTRQKLCYNCFKDVDGACKRTCQECGRELSGQPYFIGLRMVCKECSDTAKRPERTI